MLVVIIVLAVLGVAGIVIYNGMVAKRNEVENAFAGIDAQLKKRFDLIPNLVNTVKGYAQHEAAVFENIVKLRQGAKYDDLSADEKVELDSKIGQAVKQFQINVEQYPDLKASENFNQLQRALNETEEQISAARRAYNAAVTEYNTSIQSFPANLFAGALGFSKRSVYEATDAERQNVDVKF